ncbi:MAG: YggT family protein [Solirubrobacteraceae bacterium]
MLSLATTRTDIANYVGALFTVYIVVLFVYLLVNLMLSFGVRLPYSRWTDAVLGFLRDVSEPYLRIFRRLLPTMGGFDFTPMLAIIVLYILRSVIVSAIGG